MEFEISFMGPQKGFGMVAKKDFQPGDLILEEAPAFFFQELENKGTTITCCNCGKFMGSLDHQLLLACGEITRLDVPAAPSACSCGEAYCCDECREHARESAHRLLCVAAARATETDPLMLFKEHAIENNEIFLLAGEVLSRFVGQVARGEWAPLPPRGASQPAAAASSVTDTAAAATPSSPSPRSEVEALLPPDLRTMVRGEWPEVAAPSCNPRNGKVRAILREQLEESWGYLRQALGAPHPELPPPAQEYLRRVLAEGALYSELIGLFELNTIDINMASPLQALLCRMAQQGPESPLAPLGERLFGEHREALQNLVRMHAIQEQEQEDASDADEDGEEEDEEDEEEEGEDEDEDDEEHCGCGHHHAGHAKGRKIPKPRTFADFLGYVAHAFPSPATSDPLASLEPSQNPLFEPLRGRALFPRIARINHSCVPNAAVFYPIGGDEPLRARLVAVRPIVAGEEICISYIDEDLPRPKRQAALREGYRFVCVCPKCLAEATPARSEGAKKKKAHPK
ncbi:putative histone-lysine n [Paratrimastix pyriformis]|uniref:Histone-lysine n n=1 Tax=Paratrimastix pyriformis TaxID=342808 RepID=A0ABQ8UJP2_9EUKA|nr:putative histone-lysine n [Paratrimastix pyriformis]